MAPAQRWQRESQPEWQTDIELNDNDEVRAKRDLFPQPEVNHVGAL